MLYSFRGNDEVSHAYLLCRFNQCVLIDPSHQLDEIHAKLGDKELIAIILTHAHSDHMHLISYFKVPIYIQEADAHLMFEDGYNGYEKSQLRPFRRKDLDLKIIDGSAKIGLGDGYVEMMHTPGHTKGSMCIYYDNHLFTGDTLFKGDVGRHDFYSGNLFELKKSVMTILNTYGSNVGIYPGHDEFSTVRYEKKNNPFYLKWTKQIRK